MSISQSPPAAAAGALQKFWELLCAPRIRAGVMERDRIRVIRAIRGQKGVMKGTKRTRGTKGTVAGWAGVLVMAVCSKLHPIAVNCTKKNKKSENRGFNPEKIAGWTKETDGTTWTAWTEWT
jgi:hypothetical protein